MILFLYGNDTFRSGEKLNALRENFFIKNTSNANSSVFDFEENNYFDNLKESLSAEGLFSSKKLIVIKNIIESSDKLIQDKVVEYLENNKVLDDTTLIFWEKGEPRKNNKLFKLLVDKFKSENLEKISGTKLADWIGTEFKNKDISIENQAVNKLIEFVGNDLFQMKNEIEKLSNFIKTNSVKSSNIDMIVNSRMEVNIFETIEAISAGDKGRALKLLHEQLERGDDPFYILSMYIYQFRNLLKIGSFYFDGVVDKNIISKEAKLHPFVVQKGLQQLSNFSFRKLKDIYRQLEEIDIQVKTGKADIHLALDRFVIDCG